ncbi:MAG: 2-C-methyl-D-erythritol 2,4-cyclodiphosphate synthase [Pirellulaceae bacterium]|nr:2-C-methyl-D-erythritol 2,4-cyclodiphosphate synthase [Planctomycetaceae bacterium]MDG1806526.1 2-C-methyl-D-erythritol 2,4-cyclodiphosphate synthase [Pirellulaceae bacterium]MDG2105280.1 2-C-methyl-D-erythritol 2,4-cyclodiphosphate synthase [Pirellulaceae bacterium]
MNPHSLRIGIGHDTHRLQPGGPLRIGGVDIPFAYELVGHSDADVLLHAITDALLGASALGDIGELFPNTTAENHNRDSIEMLSLAAAEVSKAGFQLINIDCIIFAQKPKMLDHRAAITSTIAEALKLEKSRVSVKAKTGESVGPVGKGLSIEAQCIALLYQA